MGFEKLVDKVHQAECALEARERSVGAGLRQLKVSWRAAWTPGRIVVAGLASGFLFGRARPLRLASEGGVLQLVTALSGMIASGSAGLAAHEAEDAARAAEMPIAPVVPAAAQVAPQAVPDLHDPIKHHEQIRRRGVV